MSSSWSQRYVEQQTSRRGSISAATTRPIRRRQVRRGAADWLRVIGVPKTIDNDLPATDHCPGYGSAARFVAAVTAETALDTWAMRATDPIRLDRSDGPPRGLAARCGVAGHDGDDAPHLVYLPERPTAARPDRRRGRRRSTNAHGLVRGRAVREPADAGRPDHRRRRRAALGRRLRPRLLTTARPQ